jgi:hypothetical protein
LSAIGSLREPLSCTHMPTLSPRHATARIYPWLKSPTQLFRILCAEVNFVSGTVESKAHRLIGLRRIADIVNPRHNHFPDHYRYRPFRLLACPRRAHRPGRASMQETKLVENPVSHDVCSITKIITILTIGLRVFTACSPRARQSASPAEPLFFRRLPI